MLVPNCQIYLSKADTSRKSARNSLGYVLKKKVPRIRNKKRSNLVRAHVVSIDLKTQPLLVSESYVPLDVWSHRWQAKEKIKCYKHKLHNYLSNLKFKTVTEFAHLVTGSACQSTTALSVALEKIWKHINWQVTVENNKEATHMLVKTCESSKHMMKERCQLNRILENFCSKDGTSI